MIKHVDGRNVDIEGNIFWYKDGLLHREDGPAIEYKGGSKGWWIEGRLHREDGPAIEYQNGAKQWFLNDIEYTEVDFKYWLEKKHLNENLLSTLEKKPSVKKVKI